MLIDEAAEYFKSLQDEITLELSRLERTAQVQRHGIETPLNSPFRSVASERVRDANGGAQRFHEDQWQYPEGGGGRTRVLSGGLVFEKGGVNFSDVRGEFAPEFAASMPGDGLKFRATGISLVIHPQNPFVPTVHANFRCLNRGSATWFGGGADLTPYYPFHEDCVHFHRIWKDACNRHQAVADYAFLKQWCDDYFFLKHRKEARGIGGIFFDWLGVKRDLANPQVGPIPAHQPTDLSAIFAFVKDAGQQFLTSYVPIVERRCNTSFGERERYFQLVRRGRYVEFNLVYDRGTIFGLKTGGRIESILMSLPAEVRWDYDFQIEPNSREAELLDFLKPRNWADL